MTSIQLHAELRTDDLTVVIDTREQLPYDTAPFRSIRGTLDLTDYAPLGLESRVGVERKSLPDYISSWTSERDAFERRLSRARSLESYLLVVEAHWQDLICGNYRSRATPASIIGSTLAWMGEGIQILFCGDREAAQAATMRFLFCAARRRYRELRGLLLPSIEPPKRSRNASAGETINSFALEPEVSNHG